MQQLCVRHWQTVSLRRQLMHRVYPTVGTDLAVATIEVLVASVVTLVTIVTIVTVLTDVTRRRRQVALL
jgi:hypothetical protein